MKRAQNSAIGTVVPRAVVAIRVGFDGLRPPDRQGNGGLEDEETQGILRVVQYGRRRRA